MITPTTIIFRWQIFAVTVAILLFDQFATTTFVVAQEEPFFTPKLYDRNEDHRQNVCSYHKKYYSGQTDFNNALSGFEMNTMVMGGDLFYLKDGVIDPKYAGLMGELMDELALRAGFKWRDSFGITIDVGENKTHTEYLNWCTESFDLCVDWHIHTISRLELGIGFPKGFYDASYILIGVKGDVDKSIDMFNWLFPFEAEVWWTIIATILVSAFIYMLLENLNNKDSSEPYRWHFSWNIFLSAMAFTQQFQFEPKSNASRLFSVSLAFWSLIVVATYTANLASVFVIQRTPSILIDTIDGAVRAGMPICAVDGYGSTDDITEKYANGIFVLKPDEKDLFRALREGECKLALTNVQSFELLETDREVNKDCSIDRVGRVIKFSDAGFALKNDAGEKCTSFIQDVLNFHLVKMEDEGVISKAWGDFEARKQNLDCSGTSNSKTDKSGSISMDEMWGTFLCHFMASAVAVVIALIAKFHRIQSENRHSNEGGVIGRLPVDSEEAKNNKGAYDTIPHLNTAYSDVQDQIVRELRVKLMEVLEEISANTERKGSTSL